jgi:hypothetical protein
VARLEERPRGRRLGIAALCGGIAASALVLATWRLVRLDPLVVLRHL